MLLRPGCGRGRSRVLSRRPPESIDHASRQPGTAGDHSPVPRPALTVSGSAISRLPRAVRAGVSTLPERIHDERVQRPGLVGTRATCSTQPARLPTPRFWNEGSRCRSGRSPPACHWRECHRGVRVERPCCGWAVPSYRTREHACRRRSGSLRKRRARPDLGDCAAVPVHPPIGRPRPGIASSSHWLSPRSQIL